ncbi:MAG: O-antigen ligase family protein, partial [Planctomycetota bacterium]
AAGLGLTAASLMGFDLREKATKLVLMGRGEQVASLTGRSEIWEEVGRFQAKRPWLGWGFDSFWTPEHVEKVTENVGWGVRESHSAWLDVGLATGRLGLLLLASGLAAGWIAALRQSRREDRPGGSADPLPAYLAATLSFAMLTGFTESAMSMVLFTPFMVVCGLTKLLCFPKDAPTDDATDVPDAARQIAAARPS